MKATFLAGLAGLAAGCMVSAAEPKAKLDVGRPAAIGFRDNDRVVLLGSTFFERDYAYGHLETALTVAFAGKNLSFRNLAWSADTVWGHSRSYFGPPAEGLDRLRTHLQQIKPSVVLCNYGAVEAWDGEQKLDAFLDGYRRLLDLIDQVADHPRILLMSPAPVEVLPRPLPDLTAQNHRLANYRDAVRTLAAERSLPFFDAFQLITDAPKPGPLTDNGVAYTSEGYRFLAGLVASLAGKLPPPPGAAPAIEELRRLIVEKNRLFFHRWRPQNETYLFGFRKHEQGQNAAEIPLFDPLIEAKEKQIAQLAAGLR